MKKITINAGQPFSRPRFKVLAFNPKQVVIDFQLTDESDYYADQDDWYKLGGLSFSLVPDKHAAMFGIRKVATGWQLTPYINYDKERIYNFDALYLDKNIPYQATITNLGHKLIFDVIRMGDLNWQWFVPFDKWGWLGFVRQFYAGGDSFPLNTFSLYYQIEIK